MKLWLIVGAVVVVVVAIVFVAMRDKHEDEAPVAAVPTAASQVETAAATTPAPATDYASIQAAYLEENAKKPDWKVTGSGLQYHIIKATDDSAPKPAPGSVVTVNYEGKFIDGTVFDSSYARNEPISFPLNGVIAGWQEGVPMMRVGETWEFAIPSGLGYGPDTAGPIPGGSTLLFKIELLAAKTPAQ